MKNKIHGVNFPSPGSFAIHRQAFLTLSKMFTNMSHIRFAGEPYLSAPVPALPPLKMKTVGKPKRKSSNHNISRSNSNHSTNTGSHTATAKSKVSTINSINSSSTAAAAHAVIKDLNSKKGKKKKTKDTKKLPVGDALVVQLDTDIENATEIMDQNANSVEPFDEQISKDIALAVAIIVAEHEMLKLKYPGKYDVDEEGKTLEEDGKMRKRKKSKSKSNASISSVGGKGEESKEELDLTPPEKQEVSPSKKEDASLAAAPTKTAGQREKVQPKSVSAAVNTQKAVAASASNVTNDNASSVATPPAVKRQPGSEPHVPIPAKNESSVTFTVPSRTTTTAMRPSTASATTLSAMESNHSVSYPPLPSIGAKLGGQMEVLKYLGRIQNYMNHLGYHRLGEPGIRINTRLSMKMQMATARDIIQCSVPIKCLHAVVLAVYFTNCLDTVERFPIYFRSHVSSKEYKHIVLGIYVQGHFGALGISRDGGLQDKPTSYTKLSDLIFEFAKCYGQSGHILNEIKFGNIITHDQHSLEKLFNKNYIVPIVGCLHSDIERNVEKFAKQLRAKMGLACLKSLRADSAVSSRFSRSKTSLNGSAAGIAGSEHSSTSLRARALSMGPLTASRGSSININNNNKNEDVGSRKSSKTAVTRSKPAKPSKRK